MIFKVTRTAILATLAAFAAQVFAGEPVDKAQLEKLRAALEIPGTGLKVSSAQTSEIAGLFEVQLTDGPVVYSTADGTFFIVGDLYSAGPEGYVNLAEKRRDTERQARLAKVDKKDMIVFPAEGDTKGYISVFTDVTCFYCQKLHQEVPALTARGVEVRYLAYPRAGLASDGFKQLASAWCADNPQETLTQLKNKQSVPQNVCAGNPIAAQFQLGGELGVRGTPAIILENGQMIPGYQSAAELLQTMGLN